MIGSDLIHIASIIDLQGFGDFAEVVNGEKESQIMCFIQGLMEVKA